VLPAAENDAHVGVRSHSALSASRLCIDGEAVESTRTIWSVASADCPGMGHSGVGQGANIQKMTVLAPTLAEGIFASARKAPNSSSEGTCLAWPRYRDDRWSPSRRSPRQRSAQAGRSRLL
jgi:hypothetical protein